MISGWNCTANTIRIEIDGQSLGNAGIRTGRGDTASICGRSDTGFSLLFNYNSLSPGAHTLKFYADGALIETRQFNSVQSGGTEFLSGASKSVTVSDFPSTGRSATLQWSQAKQGFTVTDVQGGTTTPATPSNPNASVSLLRGSYYQTIISSVTGSSCPASGGTSYESITVTTIDATVIIGTSDCTFTLDYQSGDNSAGFSLKGSEMCSNGVTFSNVTVTGLKKLTSTSITGKATAVIPGCTLTAYF